MAHLRQDLRGHIRTLVNFALQRSPWHASKGPLDGTEGMIAAMVAKEKLQIVLADTFVSSSLLLIPTLEDQQNSQG